MSSHFASFVDALRASKTIPDDIKDASRSTFEQFGAVTWVARTMLDEEGITWGAAPTGDANRASASQDTTMRAIDNLATAMTLAMQVSMALRDRTTAYACEAAQALCAWRAGALDAYAGRWVAIHGGAVVAHAASGDELRSLGSAIIAGWNATKREKQEASSSSSSEDDDDSLLSDDDGDDDTPQDTDTPLLLALFVSAEKQSGDRVS